MTDREIDEVLAREAERLSGPAIPAPPREIKPVRPMASRWMWFAAFLGVFAAVSVGGAMVLGAYGFRELVPMERGLIFGAAAAVACLAALALVREMFPASGRRISGFALLVSIVVLLATFAVVFQNYDMDQFFPRGLRCLRAGLIFAIPAAVVFLLLVRRGFVVSLPAIGMAVGTLAGLAGVGVLEMHCPIFNAMHVMVWHLGVIAICGGAGWIIGRFLQRVH